MKELNDEQKKVVEQIYEMLEKADLKELVLTPAIGLPRPPRG